MRPAIIAVVAVAVVLVLRQAPSLGQGRLEADGFVIAADVTGTTEEALAAGGAGSAVQDVLGANWSIEPIGDGRYRAVQSPGTSLEVGGAALTESLSAGAAWERAHQMSRRPGIRYVEPTFTLEANQGEQDAPDRYCPPCAPEREKVSSCRNPIAGALENPDWVLDATHGANVKAAWQKFTRFGVMPGAGVVIGHPDTGYREHPEIWPGAGETRGVFPQFGWNFITDKGPTEGVPDSGPFDSLLKGFLRNPGHGTKTASVIISAEGSQFQGGSPRWVSGVSPGAMLVPLRVAEGVVLLAGDVGQVQVNVSRVAAAIRAAAGPNRDRVKRQADVISISMGGLPASRDLAEAVDEAERNGVIVVAAAGNQVPGRHVVFPAAFGPVIAVAASNYDSKPWTCSSHGSKTAITAPGETVWTANSRQDQECLHASDGTSFATAITAGIAALWLSYPDPVHQQAIKDLRSGRQLPAAFRSVLQRAAARPVRTSQTGFGAGIIDAVAVIETELSGLRLAPEADSPEWCSGPDSAAFRGLESIFRDSADGKRRVAALLSSAPDLCRAAAAADELTFWYSTDENVRAAFLGVVGSRSPSARDYARARQSLLGRDISRVLRSALAG